MTVDNPNTPPRPWQRIRDDFEAAGIELGLDRVRACWTESPFSRLSAPVCITVAGTNGKGSTVALLNTIYSQSGYRTGVYTSPHLVRFHERIALAGDLIDDEQLDELYLHFEDGARRHRLTQFEIDTVVALAAIWRARVDVAILEVGVGGRLDAVNIIDPDCAVITSIALDHMALLGPDREAIGYEKAGIMRTGRPVVLSDPMPPQSVLDRAKEVDADLWRIGLDFHFAGDKQQWGWATHPTRGGRRYSGLAYPALRGANQLVNAAGVLAAIEALRARLPVTAQSVRAGLALVELPGRFQIVPGTPTLVLDVAHNPHSVAALAENLDAMGYYPTTHAVFGAMADKDLPTMVGRVAPMIDHWHLTDLPLPRAIAAQALAQLMEQVPGCQGKVAGCHASPAQALAGAVAAADPADRIVVFGSFYTVGGVLQDGVPRLAAKHLAS